MKSITLVSLLALLFVANVTAADAPPKAKAKRAPSPSLVKIEDEPGLPRVLLIGDSISMGYTIPVRELLKGKANVHRIPTNGGPTINGLAHLKEWLGDKKWDVIHFNWGLHDLKYIGKNANERLDPKDPNAHQQVPLADYEKNLTTLVEQLKATGAKLIWCSTTPVQEGSDGRTGGSEKQYNEAAARVMKATGIPTDDLWAHANAKLKDIALPAANVHYTADGYKYLAEKVAGDIEKALQKK